MADNNDRANAGGGAPAPPDGIAQVQPPNAPPRNIPEVQSQGNVAGLPGATRADPEPVHPTQAFLNTTRTDPRFVIAPARGFNDLSIAYINLERLYLCIVLILHQAFDNWYELRNQIPGTAADQDAFINDACIALAIASVYMTYILLGSKTAHHAAQYGARYRTRAPLDKYYELPTGLMLIIEKIGFWQTSEVYNNPGVMLVWDNAEAARFGIPAGVNFVQGHLNAITQILRRLNVPFRRLAQNCPTTSGWYTLLTRTSPSGVGSDVYTTFPISNYQLPIDIFLAMVIQSPIDVTNTAGNPIEFVGYRVSVVTSGEIANRLQGAQPDNYNARENARFPAVPNGTNPGLDLHRPLAGFNRTHPSGVQTHRTGGTDAAPTYSRRVMILGRGGVQDTLLINIVARNVTPQDLVNFSQVLIRFGVPA